MFLKRFYTIVKHVPEFVKCFPEIIKGESFFKLEQVVENNVYSLSLFMFKKFTIVKHFPECLCFPEITRRKFV